MTKPIKRITNNIFVHRICVVFFFFLTIIILGFESVLRGIKLFFYYQVKSVTYCFYEIYKNFTYYFRKYSDPKLWNW